MDYANIKVIEQANYKTDKMNYIKFTLPISILWKQDVIWVYVLLKTLSSNLHNVQS